MWLGRTLNIQHVGVRIVVAGAPGFCMLDLVELHIKAQDLDPGYRIREIKEQELLLVA